MTAHVPEVATGIEQKTRDREPRLVHVNLTLPMLISVIAYSPSMNGKKPATALGKSARRLRE
jgi:hypothetical protein